MPDSSTKKFVIIDGNAIIHRAYHAIPPLTTKEGLMVNAVYGFTSMLLKVYSDLKPDYLAVSFDVAGGTFRDKLFDGYKAKRVKADQELYDQIPLIYEVVEAFGIPIYIKEGFEADDVIGTVVTKLKTHPDKVGTKFKAIVVTGDMDLLQLVDDEKVMVYGLRKGLSDMVMFDEAGVKEKYGFGPEHVVDYKALRGDASDNIPGVPGIGEKTAKELIAKIGGIDEIYEKLTKNKEQVAKIISASVIKKLEAGEVSARMSKEVATIACDVPGVEFDLESCAVKAFDQAKLLKLFQRFEFVSLLKRVPAFAEVIVCEAPVKSKKVSNKDSQKLTQVTAENFGKFVDIVNESKVLVAKEVLSGANAMESELIGLVVVVGDISYHVQPEKLSHKDSKTLFDLFSDTSLLLVGHDLKQLLKALLRQGTEVKNRLFDVMIASYLLNSGSRAHDLSSITLRELGRELPAVEQGSLFGRDPQLIASELQAVAEVHSIYKDELNKNSDESLFDKIEMALIPVLAEMEVNGIAVDTKMLGELSVMAAESVKKLTAEIWREAGEEFNIASPVQLRDILYEKMGLKIPGIKKGKTGYSTAASELEKLHGAHPIINFIEDYREITKLQNTYIDVLPTLINKKTGRIHTSFNQAVAATGRLSSSDPNLQNIPIRTELGRKIRDAFVAETGNILIAADYSQIELRIVASLAEDKTLMDIFERGEDVHRATAAAIHRIPLGEVTKEMRSAAKEINFGVLYGMGAYGLAWRAGIPQWQAKEFITKYFEEFSGVKKYIDQTLTFAKKEGYVETLFGRRRYIPELKSDNYQLRSAGERMAVNMPIQGTAADLMKMAMIAVAAKIKSLKDYKTGNIKMILQVHDELVLEVKNGLEDEVGALVKEEMESVAKLRVPVEVQVNAGQRWGEIK